MTIEERAEEVAINVIRAFDAVGPKQAGLEILVYADEIRRESADRAMNKLTANGTYPKEPWEDVYTAILGAEPAREES